MGEAVKQDRTPEISQQAGSAGLPTSDPTRGRDGGRGTWELELLISGVVIFALIQLLGRLMTGYGRVAVNLGETMALVGWMAFFYLQMAIVCVIASLLIHLTARAYWVGLIGLRSVFPRGVIWSRVSTIGPRTVRFYRARLPTLARLSGQTDAFCSTIFSFTLAMASIFLLSTVVFMPILAASVLVDRWLFDGERTIMVFYAAMLILVGPASILPLVDKRLDANKRYPLFERLLRLGLMPYYYLFGLPLISPILMTFQSNIRTRRFFGLFGVVMLLLLGGWTGVSMMASERLMLHDLRFFPRELGPLHTDAFHYRDTRPDGVYTIPSIQSAQVDSSTVALFLPYIPRWHNPVVGEQCPDLAPLQRAGLTFRMRQFRVVGEPAATVADALDCWRTLYPLTLDGVALLAEDLAFTRDADSGVHGFMAYLAVEDLTPGRHEIDVEQFRYLGRKRKRVVHTIVFRR